MLTLRLAVLTVAFASHISAQAQAVAPVESASSAASSSPGHQVINSSLGTCFRRQPPYPAAALRSEQQGRTAVAFTITETGKIENSTVYRSSGHELLDQAALAHLIRCSNAFNARDLEPLPAGRYVLPMLWRID
jgi:TonB family protein